MVCLRPVCSDFWDNTAWKYMRILPGQTVIQGLSFGRYEVYAYSLGFPGEGIKQEYTASFSLIISTCMCHPCSSGGTAIWINLLYWTSHNCGNSQRMKDMDSNNKITKWAITKCIATTLVISLLCCICKMSFMPVCVSVYRVGFTFSTFARISGHWYMLLTCCVLWGRNHGIY